MDEGLLQSSSERKYLAMELLKRLSPLLKASELQIILSDPMLVCLKQNLGREENYLHVGAKKCVRFLYSLVKKDEVSLETKSILSISLRQFSSFIKKGAEISVQNPGEGSTNKAQLLVLRKMFYSTLVGITTDSEQEEYDTHLLKRQKEILNQVCAVCKSPDVDLETAKTAIEFLCSHAFFKFSKAKDCLSLLEIPKEKSQEIAKNVKTTRKFGTSEDPRWHSTNTTPRPCPVEHVSQKD